MELPLKPWCSLINYVAPKLHVDRIQRKGKWGSLKVSCKKKKKWDKDLFSPALFMWMLSFRFPSFYRVSCFSFADYLNRYYILFPSVIFVWSFWGDRVVIISEVVAMTYHIEANIVAMTWQLMYLFKVWVTEQSIESDHSCHRRLSTEMTNNVKLCFNLETMHKNILELYQYI